MSFDYTPDAQRLVVSVPTVITRGPHGRIDGLLPLVQRLHVLNPEPFADFIRAYGPPLVTEAYVVAMRDLQKRDRRRWHLRWEAFEDDDGAGERWLDGAPTDADIARVFEVLNTPRGRTNPASRIERLRARCLSDIGRLIEAADRGYRETAPGLVNNEDPDFLSTPKLGWELLDSGRVVVQPAVRGQDPFEQCRLEVLTAIVRRGPGVVTCDVCGRWFVPMRAGHPARRCPGFECPLVAERRYQGSDERREYRRLQMRLARAERRGDTAGAADAQAAIEQLSKGEKR